MSEKRKSREEWLAEESARLKRGPTLQPLIPSVTNRGSALDPMRAGLGATGGALAPHPNPVTFQGCTANVIAEALRAELTDEDTRVEIGQAGKGIVVTIFQSYGRRSYHFWPVLSVTLLQAGEQLTVTVSPLAERAATDALSAIGGTLIKHGIGLLRRPSGLGGLLSTVGHVVQGASELMDHLEDLTLPQRVWAIIDRVGGAAEKAFLEAQWRALEQQRQREAILAAWTHCPYCGRAYAPAEAELANCPACGGARGSKPEWIP